MACARIDQKSNPVPMYLEKGDDMTPWTATFKGVNMSTVAGYTWFSRILSAGLVVKILTVTAILVGADTVVTISGLTAAESTALAATGLTYDLGTTLPLKRTYLEGTVRCD